MTTTTETITYPAPIVPEGESYVFAGDWHGNTLWVKKTLSRLAAAGVNRVYQVGDFGLWPGPEGEYYLDTVAQALRNHDMDLYVILGNHEDYGKYAQMRPSPESGGWLQLPSEKYSRMNFAPRAHVWEAYGLRFASLSGAGSIDKGLRVEGKSWWPEEEITDADRDAFIALLDERGWDNVDIFLSHEAPAGITMDSWAAANHPTWFTPEIQYYCYQQRIRLREAVDRAAPRWLIHGHWHYRHTTELEGVRTDGTDYRCTIVGLKDDGEPENLWRPGMNELVG